MKLHIKNFRSIKQLDLEIAPITVLYGHNGTGKSSVLYAPLTMKNIVLNPVQELQEFFNYQFADLGSFKDVIFDHNENNELNFCISLKSSVPYRGGKISLDYSIGIKNDNSGTFQLSFSDVVGLDRWAKTVSFPYDNVNHATYDRYEGEYSNLGEFSWNGINGKIDAVEEEIHILEHAINQPAEELQGVSFVPLGRGFFQPQYTLASISQFAATEQEMSSLLATDRNLAHSISFRMEQVLNRNFQIYNDIGTVNFSLDSFDRLSGVNASLVNEGFGVNQLVYLLAKVLHPDARIVCVEEPEIHLHPTAIRRLARTLTNIVQEEQSKRLIISTHSEQFIMSLLALVAERAYDPDKLAIYLVTKEGKESKFDRQQVNENGQVDGGLASFMEGELEDMKAFLGV